MKHGLQISVFCLLLAALRAPAVTVEGNAWRVHWNLPDQNNSAASATPDEFALRDAWLARIDALQKGDWACLSTYTFSGNTAASGAAGPILKAVSRALDRGASVGFVVGSGVNVNSNFWSGISLTSLSKRKKNPLRLAKAPSGGIMHHKMGVFAPKGKTPWVLSGSWNFTGGASTLQWNVLVEIQNAQLAAACSNELSQLLSGKFHADASKVHYSASFTLDGRPCSVRFAPQPDGHYGGDNMLRDIVAAIDGAQEEIFFALNKLTRQDVVDALIAACDRGVVVRGAIPLSDCGDPDKDSWEMKQRLLDPSLYRTSNRVRLYDAYTTADRLAHDQNQTDLVHAKYMVIDPWGASPLVIQGSPNWTASALVLTSSNDENLQFLGVPGIAQAFVRQFDAMTDGMAPTIDSFSFANGAWRCSYWKPPLASCTVEGSTSLSSDAVWTTLKTLPAARSGTFTLPRESRPHRFIRHRAPP